MEWTPEAIRAEVDYRLETARRYSTASKLRKEARSRHPSWWRRIRSQH